jgi:hypothetical protein
MVGEGISDANIYAACSFLVGWCSCQIKAQNPGVDLLMLADWNNMIQEGLYEETTMLLQASGLEEPESALADSSSNLKRNVMIAVLAQFVIVAIVALVVLWRRRQKA